MKKNFRYLFFLIILIIRFTDLHAQDLFSHLGIEKGLSNNSVNAIYKDRFGFMWFGTDDGLNQYNGYSFRIYRNNPNDSSSLVNNQVIGMAEDGSGTLWIATKRGVSVLHSFPSKFVKPIFKAYNDKKARPIDQEIYAIKGGNHGDVFIGASDLGLLVYDNRSRETRQVSFQPGEKVLTPYSIRAIRPVQDRAWLINPAKGLAYYDYRSKQISLVSSNGDIRNANSIEADQSGNLWIGTDHGLYRYNISAKSFKWYSVAPGQLLAQRILSLAFDRRNRLLIATDGGGINIMDTEKESFSYQTAGESPSSLNSNAISVILKDEEHRIWVGTLRGGINVLDRKRNEFKHIYRNPLSQQSLVSDFILSFCEDRDGKIWIGTDGGGISLWDRLKSFKTYRHENGNPQSLSSNNVTSIVRSNDDVIWIATFGGGINRYNRGSGTFKYYPCANSWGKDENVWKLFIDKKGGIWAGTCVGVGLLYHYNVATDRFEPFNNEHLKNIIAINEDKLGNLWFGSFNKLYKYTPGGKVIPYDIRYPVRSIFFNKSGDLFVGTQYAGLLKYNPKNGSFQAFTESDGLSNNTVLNIEEDDHANLWLSTFNGLTKFNYRNNTFNKFYIENGLQCNEFNYNASAHLRSGQLLFGGIKGFNIFNPDSIMNNSAFPPLRLTDLRASNEPLISDAAYSASLYDTKEIKIPYDRALLSFDYSALEYSFPSRISYSYYLEGLENNWNNVRTARSGNYSRLHEGTYVLHIRSTNGEGIWNPRQLTLKIIILPPWYRSWWAYLTYLAIISYLLYRFNRYKSNQVRLNYQIEMATANAEKERELNERKLSFFTHISHEFRSPLTLIINPVKELLYSSGKNIDVSDLSIVYLNAKRLLSLVDQLLLFRKADHEEDDLKISKLNIVLVCKDVFLCFTSQARLKNIDIAFESAEEYIEIFADREKIEIVLFNILSNAFKFTEKNGSIHVKVEDNDGRIAILIKDNGRGIHPEIGDKLFDKFYQAPKSYNVSVKGFGIGLYLAKKFITSHKGELTYHSEIGQGTVFQVELLKGLKHLAGITVHHEDTEFIMPDLDLAQEDAEEPVTAMEQPDSGELDNLVSEQPAILIVDDNELFRQYIKRIFKESFIIYEAVDGEDGLLKAKKQLPDIIISDVTMPVKDGIQLCTEIKADPAISHIPVILLTSSTSSEIKLKGLECGAEDYITKPFEAELLTARINNILKSRNSLQRYFYNAVTLQADNQKISPTFKEFLSKCISITERHLDNPDFNTKVLANEVGMSHSALYKKVKSISGKSINEFIRFIRLRKAAELLIQTDSRVNEAAFRAGFNNQKYFREQFTKLFEMTPSEYIKKYRKTL